MNFLPTSKIPNYIPRHIIGFGKSVNKNSKLKKYSLYIKIVGIIIAVALIINPAFSIVIKPIISPLLARSFSPTVKADYIIKPITTAELASIMQSIQDPNIKGNSTSFAYVVPLPLISEKTVAVQDQDPKIKAMKQFLIDNNSPMVGNAADFVNAAKQYGIDWRLVASISGAESGFGKYIPKNPSGGLSYNAWGWGKSSSGFTNFTSWTDAIYKISQSIANNYGIKSTPSSMEATYCPPCSINHNWQNEVYSFMSELASY